MITGHTGFVGSWLTLALLRLEAKVFGYSLAPSTQPSLFEETGLANRIAGHCLGDVRDAAALSQFLQSAAPEIVLHLAAQPLVRRSYRDPVETFTSNAMGTVNLLEAVRKTETVKVVLVITSDKCYRNDEAGGAFRESDPLGGHDPYSASKACQEIIAHAYARSFFDGGAISLATARAGNILGGGDWAEDRILPDCIAALTRHTSIAVRNPDAIRPWQHVLEPVFGYLRLAERQWELPDAYSGAWNFGPESENLRTVAELVTRVCACWGDGRWHRESAEIAPPYEAQTLRLDIGKSDEVLDWRPRLDFDTTVQWTTEWYRAHLQNPAATFALSNDQIERYLETPPLAAATTV
ncbi:MAG: CDP-glucose 4,6-dehydratase [Gammaproteobacteria bacterium]